nr:hypothetical protein [Micromonospora sp. DSM 115978]
MADFVPPGYSSRDEYIDDLHQQWLSRLSGRDGTARWWRMNWLGVCVPGVLLVGALALWMWS